MVAAACIESICVYRNVVKSIVGLFYLILILAISKSCFLPIGVTVPKRYFLKFCFSIETIGAVVMFNYLQMAA